MTQKKSIFLPHNEAIDFKNSINYYLSIRLMSDGLSFLLLDRAEKKIKAYKRYFIQEYDHVSEYELYINKILDKEIWIQQKYAKIILAFHSPQSSNLPLPFYEEGQEAELYAFCDNIQPQHHVLASKLEQLDLVQLFVVGSKLKHLLDRYFPDADWQHYSHSLIKTEAKKSELLAKNSTSLSNLSVQINPSFFHVHLLKEGQLVFSNVFRYKTKEDLLYYLLYSCQQLELKPEQVALTLYIEHTDLLPITDYLRTYFSALILPELSSKFVYNNELMSLHSASIASQILDLECAL